MNYFAVFAQGFGDDFDKPLLTSRAAIRGLYFTNRPRRIARDVFIHFPYAAVVAVTAVAVGAGDDAWFYVCLV
jgi:hypothetical protein